MNKVFLMFLQVHKERNQSINQSIDSKKTSITTRIIIVMITTAIAKITLLTIKTE